jgi:hypothetical protein
MGTSERGDFLSIVFDTNHDAGHLARQDDLRLDVYPDGTMEASRGNALGGFVPLSASDWDAVIGPDEFRWGVEMRIRGSMLGGVTPGRWVGFHIRHNRVRWGGDDFGFPSTARSIVPNTWGHLYFLEPATDPELHVSTTLISQGFDEDLTGGVFYDLIAGKDTLAAGNLYNLGPRSSIEQVSCFVLPEGSWIPALFPPAAGYGLDRFVRDSFSNLSAVSCWVPGELVSTPGTYHFGAVVRTAHRPDPSLPSEVSAPQTLHFGSRRFREERALRLILAGNLRPPGHPDYMPDLYETPVSRWAAIGLLSQFVRTAAELNRRYPLRNGVGMIDDGSADAATAQAPGLRLAFAPLLRCEEVEGERAADTDERCNDEGYRYAWEAYLDLTSELLRREEEVGRPIDRVDKELSVSLLLNSPGGQARNIRDGILAPLSCRPGAGMDANAGGNASLFGHEIAHCFNQVRPESPHSWSANPSHSINNRIHFRQGRGQTDTIQQQVLTSDTGSMMTPVVGSNTFLEGWEWNDLRWRLVAYHDQINEMDWIGRPPVPLSSGATASARVSESEGVLELVGTVGTDNSVRIHWVARRDGPIPVPQEDPESPYTLVFLGDGGQELDRVGIPTEFEGADGRESLAPLLIAAAVPEESRAVEVQFETKVLWHQDFSSKGPVVATLSISPGKGGVWLDWTASDADSPSLRYRVYYRPAANAVRRLVASGLSGGPHFFDTTLVAPTQDGRVIVEASDGFHTARATSNPFRVEAKPPATVIQSLEPDAPGVAGRSFTLAGIGYDLAAGMLPDEALAWDSNLSGSLGTGQELAVTLPAGIHDIRTPMGTGSPTPTSWRTPVWTRTMPMPPTIPMPTV